MRLLRNYVPPAIGLSALVAGVLIGTSAPAVAAAAREVLVVNTTSQPVPVAAQGTTSVAGTVSAQQSGSWTVGISGTPSVTVANAVKIDPAGNTVNVGNAVTVANLPTDSLGRLKTVRLGTLTQVSGPFTALAISGAAIGPKVDTTSCHSVLALFSIDTLSALPPLNPLDLRLEMYIPGGPIVGRVTGTIVNDTVFQATAAEFVVNGAPVVPPVSQLEYQNHNSVNIKVLGVWLYCAP